MKTSTIMSVILLTVTASMAVSCGSNLPPLLQDVSAAGGWYGGCPRDTEEAAQPLALSPELNSRLRKLFPPGSSSNRLQALLLSQGFTIGAACAADTSIKTASFLQKKYFLYQLQADVFWKVDRQKRVVWTEGFVYYDGL